MEYFEKNLRESIAKPNKNIFTSLANVKLYAQQLLIALYYMKKKRIVHADSKFMHNKLFS
jgi:serine/threonine protein kinase